MVMSASATVPSDFNTESLKLLVRNCFGERAVCLLFNNVGYRVSASQPYVK